MKCTLTLLAGILLAPLGVADTVAPTKPSIILFLVDDMGWVDCGAYGSKYYDTPRMDRFAKQGMRFTQAYACPLCSPTRASLLTGQYSARHGITSATGHKPPQPAGFDYLSKSGPSHRALLMPESKNYLEPSQYTLAEALRDAGFRTGHFGKWHLGLTEPYWPEKQGFEVAFHCEPSAGPPNAYFSPYGVLPPGADKPRVKGRPHLRGTITDGPPGEYITDRLTDEAIKFIETNKDKPFFLNLWHYGVHGPWGHKESITAEMAKRTDPTGRQGNAVMASMLKSVDESLGRILDKLDELQLAKNTIVVFTSDNGGNTHSMTEDEEGRKPKRDDTNNPTVASYRKWAGHKPPTNNSPLRDGKGSLYEGGTRVPLVVRWPGRIAAGATSDVVVGCIDVYPTVLDLIGLARNPQQKMDGMSYAPVLRGAGKLTRDAYFIWFPHNLAGVSIRQGDWKLIRRFEERANKYEGTRELFNLKDDLGETTNLATKMPDNVRELDALIDAFVKDTGALYPCPNPAYKPRPPAKPPEPKSAAAPEKLIKGLVMQRCKATLVEGGVRIEATGKKPYIGTAQVKLTGPITLQLRARSAIGGAGSVKWRTVEEAEFPKALSSTAFTLAAGNKWQDISIELPVKGRTAIVQLHLPAAQLPVDVQSIRYADRSGQAKAWEFGKAKP